MVGMIVNTARLDGQVLKHLSKMYENGVSLRDISKELGMDERTVKRLLRLLGYASAD